MRHSIAEPASTTLSDFDRTLTEEGRKKAKKVSKGLCKLVEKFDLICSSPLVRAKQTAELVAETVLYDKKTIQILNHLIPSSSPADLRATIKKVANKQNPKANHVLLVGHEPDLGIFAAFLLDGRGPFIKFKKSSVCCIEFHHGRAHERGLLRWHVGPEVF